MSSGLASTRRISSLRSCFSSFSQSLTYGSQVATTASRVFDATGRILKRAAYALDITSVTVEKLILRGSMWKYSIPVCFASHSVSHSMPISFCGGLGVRHFWSAITTRGWWSARCNRRSAISFSASALGTRPSATMACSTSERVRRWSCRASAAVCMAGNIATARSTGKHFDFAAQLRDASRSKNSTLPGDRNDDQGRRQAARRQALRIHRIRRSGGLPDAAARRECGRRAERQEDRDLRPARRVHADLLGEARAELREELRQ